MMQFTKACARCRHQKIACRAGSDGGYPCEKCQESGSECRLVEKYRTPAGTTLSDRIARQETLTNALKSDLERLQGLAEQVPQLRSQLEAVGGRRASASSFGPSPTHTSDLTDLINPDVGTTVPAGDGDFAGRGAYRGDVKESAIQELETGQIPTNSLGDGARMLGLPSYTLVGDNESRKRKRGGSLGGAAIAYTIFAVRCLPTTYFLDPNESGLTGEVILSRSPLLYWSAVAVGSRETAELEETYRVARAKTLELYRQTLDGPRISYWDLCGAIVYHKWLAPIKPIGHIVDLAYELGIHRTFQRMTDRSNPSEDQRMQIRLWLTVTIQDYYYSIASGCPPHYSDRSVAFEQANWLLNLPDPLPGDQRLAATYEYEELSHSLQDMVFRQGTVSSDWARDVSHRLEAIERWYQKWAPIAGNQADDSDTFSMYASVTVNYHLARLAVNSVGLQGVQTAQDVSAVQLKHVHQGVSAARAQCRLCADEFQPPTIQYVPESTIFAFVSSSVFLLKVLRLLPSMDQREVILSEISAVADVLGTLRDRGQGSFLREMLSHLQARLKSRPATRAPSPSPGVLPDLPPGFFDNTTPDWSALMPQLEMERSLEPDALWAWMSEAGPAGGDHEVANYSVDPFDWSVHLNSL